MKSSGGRQPFGFDKTIRKQRGRLLNAPTLMFGGEHKVPEIDLEPKKRNDFPVPGSPDGLLQKKTDQR